MKKLIFTGLLLIPLLLTAQKVIEIKPDGEVFPRVSLTSTTDNVIVNAPSLSQMVYSTNTALGAAIGTVLYSYQKPQHQS